MCRNAAPGRFAGALVLLTALVAGVATAAPQTSSEALLTGPAQAAWQKWSAAMQAVLERTADKSEAAFGELLALEPTPLRIALLADRTVRSANAGALLLFEQDIEAGTLQDNGKKIGEMLSVGREQLNQADDGWYFSSIGRFDVAAANFRALLDSKPDPVGLLEFADAVKQRRDLLVQLIDNPQIGASVRELMELIAQGEQAVKADPTHIKALLDKLAGPPRAVENAVEALKESGEYALPFIVQYLRTREHAALGPAIIRALPQIGRPALNPLVIALRMDDLPTKRELILAAGKIGYAQAAPYLLAIAADKGTSPEIQEAVAVALRSLRERGVAVDGGAAAEAFYELAEAYYRDQDSLRADPRLATANVWYWREGMLQNVVVPTLIFNEIMAMRCCEEALRLQADHRGAQALWIAANFRREAQLPAGQSDATRPAEYPSGHYFAQSAGADICLLALSRAVDEGDPAVALGTIDALRKIAGPASLVADQQGRLPLAEALSFPNRMVRIRAALALGSARPESPFLGHQNLIPALGEALQLHGGARRALVAHPSDATANAIAGALRAAGYDVLINASLFAGLDQIRKESPSLDLVVIASDVQSPALGDAIAEMRKDYRFAATPLIVATGPGDKGAVDALVRGDHRARMIEGDAAPERFVGAASDLAKAVGAEPLTPEVGTMLALDAAGVLRLLAETGNRLLPLDDAEPALLVALQSKDTDLRRAVAGVLGFFGSAAAQDAIAAIALNASEPQDVRVLMFASLADAAKRRGALLGEDARKKIVELAEKEPDLTIREAASRTLGALNLPGDLGSEIIRNQYGG